MYCFVCVNVIGAHGPYRAGFAGAFVDKEVETRGVCYVISHIMSDKPDLVPLKKIARLHRQGEGETSRWASIALRK
jgi:hypothetical protein